MAEVSWFGILIDVGLLCSLVVFGLRMVRSSGPKVNLGRMAELEASLRALLGEADSASRALNDQLVRRQKDLEKLLFDLEGSNGRLNRQITAADEVRGQLEIHMARATAAMRALETSVTPHSRTSDMANQSSVLPLASSIESSMAASASVTEVSRRVATHRGAEFPSVEVEPPSFQSVQTAASAVKLPLGAVVERRVETPRPSLRDQIEREVFAPENVESPKSPRRRSAVERALAHQRGAEPRNSIHADRDVVSEARTHARRLGENELLTREDRRQELPLQKLLSQSSAIVENEEAQDPTGDDEDKSSVLTAEEAALANPEDPRLGVLSGAPIRRQVQVL